MTSAERLRALATALRMTQWAIDDATFKLPRGELSHAKRAELAGILRDLASLLLATAPGQQTPDQLKTEIAGGTDEWAEETELLRRLRGQGWTLWAFGDRERPSALAAVRQDATTADVIVIRGHDRVAAYRTLITPGVDPLRAGTVIWSYQHTALETLRQVFRLDTLNIAADAQPYPIPAECRVPELDRRPITIVPPCGNS